MRQAQFAETLLLSDRPPPPGSSEGIMWKRIDRLHSRADYSAFMLRNLAQYIRTPHALCIQWDGFVLNGEAWDPAFLDYDYIGAPWPHFQDGHNVGNGGFSLRSRRLLDACRGLPFDEKEPEDVLISRRCRRDLEVQGLRFAPESVARSFSYERFDSTGREFGFHGVFNLVRYLSRGDALGLFRTLEPGMLARNERVQVLRWAIARGQIKLALNILARLS